MTISLKKVDIVMGQHTWNSRVTTNQKHNRFTKNKKKGTQACYNTKENNQIRKGKMKRRKRKH